MRTEPSLKSDYDTDSNGLEYGNSGLLSNYTTEMRTIINDYNREHSIANDTYYLFLVPTASDNAVTGYMPRKKQAGFIFTNQLNGANLTKTIAHELAHGAFRLEHTFPKLPEDGNNLMDYSSTGTQLHKHQWDNIHDPVAVLGLFEGDEDAASLCTWWYQSITSNIWPSESDKVLESKAPLFDHVHQNFDTYFAASQTENKDITGHTGWSARKSSFTKKNNLTLIERVVRKFLNESIPSFDLSDKGVFLSEYSIEGKTYKVALYSEQKEIDLDKTQVDELCDLVDHEVIKVVLEDDYILISFFKEKTLQMTLQIFASEDDDAELWLKYLGILIKTSSVLDQVKAYWDGLWEEVESEDWPESKIVIRVKRVRNNAYRTVGTINIDNGEFKGYILELPKGTDTECQTVCTQERKDEDKCKRILKGEYKFEVTTYSLKEWAIGTSLRLHDIPGRSGVLMHRGVNARIWSEGCLLVMRNDPSNDLDTASKDDRANDVDDSHAFSTEIANYINQREIEIKAKFKLDKVEKLFIISDENEIQD